MSIAMVFIIAGLVIVYGAFVFAAVNILYRIISYARFSGFEDIQKRYVVAMILTVLGGLIFVFGLFLGFLSALEGVIK